MGIELFPQQTPGATVRQTTNGWRLDIPAGASRTYCLAQLDDYAGLRRNRFSHTPPLTFSLRARLSAADLPGTWGFGLWNDPFGLSLGFGGNPARFPVLPQATWFFHASPPNWLSLRDDLPAQGFFAGTFRSPPIPSLLLAPGLLAAPFLALRPASRLLRRLAAKIIRQDGAPIDVDVTAWHEYILEWTAASCTFRVDGSEVLRAPVSPPAPLGLVIWIDNQYAAWTQHGEFRYGLLENPSAWMEIEDLKMS